ncbi:hypothetical protein PanWU01x14_323180 [Parasponia andersonii]|uniref:Uncharacterized protein n=1 Tax=Parasponia andersonii TaxID=3476 RepID=A0A2P5AKK8_PARAD|nr:hypothetical protein PanWU01x14_323180 [Parasponia andersonii]
MHSWDLRRWWDPLILSCCAGNCHVQSVTTPLLSARREEPIVGPTNSRLRLAVNWIGLELLGPLLSVIYYFSRFSQQTVTVSYKLTCNIYYREVGC